MFFKIELTDPSLSPSRQSNLARRLLRDLLADCFDIPNLPEMAVTDNGKPFFPSHPEIHFSISHCKVAVMVAADFNEIGCDIEEIEQDFPLELLDVAFSEHEKAQILSSKNPNREFTAIWTRKEAIVKKNGEIPDDPISWPSDAPHVLTIIPDKANYAFSIARTVCNA